MAYIQVYYDGALIDEVELHNKTITVGRGRQCDIRIDNAGVSSHHASILKIGDRYAIQDENSRNGLFINGKRVPHRPLQFGDEIQLLKHTLRFVKTQRAAPPQLAS